MWRWSANGALTYRLSKHADMVVDGIDRLPMLEAHQNMSFVLEELCSAGPGGIAFSERTVEDTDKTRCLQDLQTCGITKLRVNEHSVECWHLTDHGQMSIQVGM